MRVIASLPVVGSPYKPIGLILDGDSITAQDSGSHIQFGLQYWDLPASQNYRAGYGQRIVNAAVSGEQFSTMLGNIATSIYPQIAAAHALGLLAVCSCWAGTNDISLGGVTDPTVILATAKSYFQACKAQGADFCIAHTITPANGRPLAQLTCALQFNLLLRAQFASMGVDAVCDVASDVNMGQQSQTGSSGGLISVPAAGYYFDGLHPNQSGAFLASGYFAEAVLSLQGSHSFLQSVTPSTGPIAGGTTVTLTGSGLTGATRVTLGGLPAVLVSVGDAQITCTSIASNVAGTGPVVVMGPNGTSRINGAWRYT